MRLTSRDFYIYAVFLNNLRSAKVSVMTHMWRGFVFLLNDRTMEGLSVNVWAPQTRGRKSRERRPEEYTGVRAFTTLVRIRVVP